MEENKKKKMELKFIYNSTKKKDKEALVQMKSLDQRYVQVVDIHREKMTERQLAELAQKIGIELEGLLDTSSDLYRDEIAGTNYDPNDILVLIKNNSDLLNTPIIDFGDKAQMIGSPYDISKMDLAFAETDKSMANKGEKDN